MSIQTLKTEKATVTIDTANGALIQDWDSNGVQLLFSNTIINGRRRGGIPLLFPNAGVGKAPLMNHGFARDLEWDLIEKTDSSISLKLCSNPETFEVYPHQFEIIFRVKLMDFGLGLHFLVKNNGEKDMPVAPGFHPYFFLPNDERTSLELGLKKFSLDTFTWDETVSLLSPSETTIKTRDYSLKMTAAPEFKRTMVWSEPVSEFICVEPWAGEAAILSPGNEVDFWMNLEHLV